jgi:hypothetical protein
MMRSWAQVIWIEVAQVARFDLFRIAGAVVDLPRRDIV